jgi:hypothetical protein
MGGRGQTRYLFKTTAPHLFNTPLTLDTNHWHLLHGALTGPLLARLNAHVQTVFIDALDWSGYTVNYNATIK